MNLAEIGIQYTFKYQNTDDKRFIKKIKRIKLINIQKIIYTEMNFNLKQYTFIHRKRIQEYVEMSKNSRKS